MPRRRSHSPCMLHPHTRHSIHDCPEVAVTTQVLTEAWWDYERDGRRLPSRFEIQREVRRRLNRERNRRLRARRMDIRRRQEQERLAAEATVKSEEPAEAKIKSEEPDGENTAEEKTNEETNKKTESNNGENEERAQGNTLASS